MAVYQTSLSLGQIVGFSIAGAGTYHYSQINTSVKVSFELNEKLDPPVTRRKVMDEETNLLD